MAYTQAELSGPVQFGDDKKKFFYDASDAGDSFATVVASGYFNNSDDDIRMAVDDRIEVKTSAGVFELIVTASTGGAVTTQYIGGETPVETGSTSVTLNGYGATNLAATTGAQRIYALPAPVRAGQRKSLIATTSTVHTVVAAAGTIGTTGGAALGILGLATSIGRGAELVALSTTQWVLASMTAPSTGIITTS